MYKVLQILISYGAEHKNNRRNKEKYKTYRHDNQKTATKSRQNRIRQWTTMQESIANSKKDIWFADYTTDALNLPTLLQHFNLIEYSQVINKKLIYFMKAFKLGRFKKYMNNSCEST